MHLPWIRIVCVVVAAALSLSIGRSTINWSALNCTLSHVLSIKRKFALSAAPSSETTVSPSSMESSELDRCDHKLTKSNKYLDYPFWKKFFKHWVPFTSSARVKMQFFLFKRDFPDCGRELFAGDDETLERSGFDARHPTRWVYSHAKKTKIQIIWLSHEHVSN